MQFTTVPPASIRTPYTHAPSRRVLVTRTILHAIVSSERWCVLSVTGQTPCRPQASSPRCHTFPVCLGASPSLFRRSLRPHLLFFSHPVSTGCAGTRLSLRHPCSPPLPAALSRRLAVTISNDRFCHPALVPRQALRSPLLSRAASPPPLPAALPGARSHRLRRSAPPPSPGSRRALRSLLPLPSGLFTSASRGPFSALAATASGDRLRHPALVPARRFEARSLSRAASPPPPPPAAVTLQFLWSHHGPHLLPHHVDPGLARDRARDAR